MATEPADGARVETRLRRGVSRAITDFGMIADGDRILVAVSGGKDSYAMLALLRTLQERAPVRFELKAVAIDQGHPGYPAHVLRDYMAREGVDFTLIREDTYSIVREKLGPEETQCSLCSRLRRGILYRVAKELGCRKIALGHHRDDILQTFLLNVLFAGQLAAMPPILSADGGTHVVIRPLAYCAEEDIRSFAQVAEFPIIACTLCGSQPHMQRKIVGKLLDDLERARPGTKQVMLAALGNVRPSHLLDKSLWQTLGLAVTNAVEGVPGDPLFGPERLLAERDRRGLA
ncbi:MAG: tRNA 2-thiocytidine(32) synthetase TtcA [Polyangiaceae bacterium]|jgi:tRNA 2-thiocytidine biosynthesis protein TtcA